MIYCVHDLLALTVPRWLPYGKNWSKCVVLSVNTSTPLIIEREFGQFTNHKSTIHSRCLSCM